MRIDTHYHASPYWWEPVEVFLFHMDRSDVDAGVLVQALGEYDNAYLADCVRRYPDRLAAIGLVDLDGGQVEQEMRRWFDAGLAGFRMALPQESTLREPFVGWQTAGTLGAVVSVVGTTRQLADPAFAQVVRTFPDVLVVIEHLGVLGRLVTAGHGGDNDVPQPPYTEYREVLALSENPNVYIKVTGFAEYMPRPRRFAGRAFDLATAPPFVDMCIEAFGADRMMVGTDPSSSVREGYANVWRDVAEYLTRFSAAEQAAVLGGTAARLFGFGAAHEAVSGPSLAAGK